MGHSIINVFHRAVSGDIIGLVMVCAAFAVAVALIVSSVRSLRDRRGRGV